MDGTTAFRVLGVSPGASKQTIKKAFRRLAQRAHPDVSGNAEAFVRLKNAYDIAYGSAQSAEVVPTEATAPLSGAGTQSLESPAVPRPRRTRLVKQSAPWLTTVLTDFPPTEIYESMVGPATSTTRVVSATAAAKRREDDFAQHLAKAMARAA